MTFAIQNIDLRLIMLVLFNPINLGLGYMMYIYVNCVRRQLRTYDSLILLIYFGIVICSITTYMIISIIAKPIRISTTDKAAMYLTEEVSSDVHPQCRSGVRGKQSH